MNQIPEPPPSNAANDLRVDGDMPLRGSQWSAVCPDCGAFPLGDHYCPGVPPFQIQPMIDPQATIPVHATYIPTPPDPLRKAAAETLLAGALLLSDAQRDSPNWQQTCMARGSEERFRKALEQLREALS